MRREMGVTLRGMSIADMLQGGGEGFEWFALSPTTSSASPTSSPSSSMASLDREDFVTITMKSWDKDSSEFDGLDGLTIMQFHRLELQWR